MADIYPREDTAGRGVDGQARAGEGKVATWLRAEQEITEDGMDRRCVGGPACVRACEKEAGWQAAGELTEVRGMACGMAGSDGKGTDGQLRGRWCDPARAAAMRRGRGRWTWEDAVQGETVPAHANGQQTERHLHGRQRRPGRGDGERGHGWPGRGRARKGG